MELIPQQVLQVMERLQEQDARDRTDGTPREKRLRQISPEVGEFLATLVLAMAARTIVEVGTSAGYSTLWLASAARLTHGRVVTFEKDPDKVVLASQTFSEAGVADIVELRHEDGVAGLSLGSGGVDLIFIDAEKDVYERLLEPAVGAHRVGGALVADNLISHEQELAGFRTAALGHPLLWGLVVPIGRGELLSVKTS